MHEASNPISLMWVVQGNTLEHEGTTCFDPVKSSLLSLERTLTLVGAKEFST